MQKITPFLWFDNQAEEAANWYVSIFENSKIVDLSRYSEESPGLTGTVMTATFQLEGQSFTALNGGPHFTFTPAISFFVNCATRAEINRLWGKLSEGGSVLMDLAAYPFSECFGWVADRFGVSWQLNLAPRAQKITPFLMFVGAQHGKAEAAMNLYTSLFENASIVSIERYGPTDNEPEGTVKHAIFSLAGQEFMAIDSSFDHQFTFTPAISFFVNCETQEEVDALWEKLSDGGATEQCGWLKDRYGLSWQIVPTVLGELLGDPDHEKSGRVMQAMLQMVKLDIRTLQEAYYAHTDETSTPIPLERLAAPARRALAGAGYTTLQQLAQVREAEVKQLHGIGPNALSVLREALAAQGMAFARDGYNKGD